MAEIMNIHSSTLKKDMPYLAKHEGVWDGWYRHFDADSKMVDEHRSRLVCRFPDDGSLPYHQTNYYSWANGKKEVRDFPADYKDGRLLFDNELIKGWAAEVRLDEFRREQHLVSLHAHGHMAAGAAAGPARHHRPGRGGGRLVGAVKALVRLPNDGK